MRLRVLLLVVALLVAGLVAGVRAQTSNTAISVGGLPQITLSVDGVVAVCSNADTGVSASKRCAVVGTEIDGGVPVHLMVRLQKAPNGFFIDIITGSTLSNLDTRVGSMDITGVSHPSPTEDTIDTAALVDAAD